jgi:hypothetical protein
MWIITGEVTCDEYTGSSLRAFYNEGNSIDTNVIIVI